MSKDKLYTDKEEEKFLSYRQIILEKRILIWQNAA